MNGDIIEKDGRKFVEIDGELVNIGDALIVQIGNQKWQVTEPRIMAKILALANGEDNSVKVTNAESVKHYANLPECVSKMLEHEKFCMGLIGKCPYASEFFQDGITRYHMCKVKNMCLTAWLSSNSADKYPKFLKGMEGDA